jgi:hypothetical protein
VTRVARFSRRVWLIRNHLSRAFSWYIIFICETLDFGPRGNAGPFSMTAAPVSDVRG